MAEALQVYCYEPFENSSIISLIRNTLKQRYFGTKDVRTTTYLGLIFNNSMATEGLAHGSSQDPGDTDAKKATEEQMEGGIHVDIGRGERTCIDMDCCQMNEAVRSNSGNPGGVIGQVNFCDFVSVIEVTLTGGYYCMLCQNIVNLSVFSQCTARLLNVHVRDPSLISGI
ncbi:hypothetical protein CJ030_MR5G010204 [Morella rubra]|uniref:Uncharacterized protein n=1 Tax=Morella rubra TaxID=262757 RepID=A0A6A1VJD3_9ROSI|nr:hypothetical protein CJ030_MR5G010204 [Morella rubra]